MIEVVFSIRHICAANVKMVVWKRTSSAIAALSHSDCIGLNSNNDSIGYAECAINVPSRSKSVDAAVVVMTIYSGLRTDTHALK